MVKVICVEVANSRAKKWKKQFCLWADINYKLQLRFCYFVFSLFINVKPKFDGRMVFIGYISFKSLHSMEFSNKSKIFLAGLK